MKTKLLTWIPGMTLAVLFTMLVGSAGAHDRKLLQGTWNITVQLGRCDAECPCPPGITTDTQIPALHMYQQHGSILEVPGGSLLRGVGVGSWKRIGHREFEARYKFFLFNPSFGRSGSGEVTNHIHLTGHDAFEATVTLDAFDAAGNKTSPEEGCPGTQRGTRFE